MELETKLYIVDGKGEKFMGYGVLWLLEEVGRKGSLRAAAASMGLSYSKAWTMVKRLEDAVGREFLSKRKGGAAHPGATLTPFAVSYMEEYREFQKRAKTAASDEFALFSKRIEALMEDKSESVSE